MKMHEGELDVDGDLVERLITTQFPNLAHLPITSLRPTGTVNAIYRLGDHLYARLPRRPTWVQDLHNELTWLPELAPQVSLKVPEPVAVGRPAHSYPVTWAIYRWIEGQPYQGEIVRDERQAAEDLAQFVTELRRVDPHRAPPAGRAPLRQLDAETRAAIRACGDVVDTEAATAAWETALHAPEWDGTPVWIHADLLRPNLLVDNGRLHAVVDFGQAGAGDPAADVIAAWSVFTSTGRETYRATLDVDDDTWDRARGYALHQAALIIPYYTSTNPAFVQHATRTIQEILTDTSD